MSSKVFRRAVVKMLAMTSVAGLMAVGAAGSSQAIDFATANPGAGNEAALEKLKGYMEEQTEWSGPKEGPVLQAGKKIIFVAYDMNNTSVAVWASALKKIADAVGWDIAVMDGQGQTAAQQSAMLQAIAQKPDGIILGVMPDVFRPLFQRAADAGIKVVGMHSAPGSGAFPEYGLFWNVGQDPVEVGRALIDWIIVHSQGKARVIITSDTAFVVPEQKAKGMREEIATCKECEVLLDTQVPFAGANTRVPQLITAWVNEYGSGGPFYIAQPADYFTDFQIPALRAAGVKLGDVILTGMDAAPAVYDRIRAGDTYHEVSAPLPYEMQAYQAIDEMNRALSGQPPAEFATPVHIIDRDNVDNSGGKDNTYIPANQYAERFLELWKTGSTK